MGMGCWEGWEVEKMVDLLTGVILAQGVDSQRGSSVMKRINHCLHFWLELGVTLR